MGVKISEMTAADALDGSELVEVTQGGSTRRTTAQAIANLGGGGGGGGSLIDSAGHAGVVSVPDSTQTSFFSCALPALSPGDIIHVRAGLEIENADTAKVYAKVDGSITELGGGVMYATLGGNTTEVGVDIWLYVDDDVTYGGSADYSSDYWPGGSLPAADVLHARQQYTFGPGELSGSSTLTLYIRATLFSGGINALPNLVAVTHYPA